MQLTRRMRARPLKRGAARALKLIGGYRVTSFLLRGSPRVFMYHRFARSPEPRKTDLATFDSHLRTLRRSFRVMTMQELGRYLRRDGRAPAHAAVITVDDGYRDFCEVAAPALRAHGMRATLYVTTRFAAGGFWLWPDALEHALSVTDAAELDLGERGRWPLGGDGAGRSRAWAELVDRCVRLPNDDRQALIAAALEALGVDLPTTPPPEYAAASPAELRELADDGFEIGAHTETHPILSRLSPDALRQEIRGAKRQLEEWLGREVSSFCYPNGQRDDYDEAVKAEVRAAGFESAVAAYFHHDVASDPYDVKRYSGSVTEEQFERNAFGIEYLSSALRERFGI